MWTLFSRLHFFLKFFQEDNNEGKLKGNAALFILEFGPVKYGTNPVTGSRVSEMWRFLWVALSDIVHQVCLH